MIESTGEELYSIIFTVMLMPLKSELRRVVGAYHPTVFDFASHVIHIYAFLLQLCFSQS